jgi:hypothetical protein
LHPHHIVKSVDLQPAEDDPLCCDHIVGDAMPLILSGDWDMIIAHPVCTYLANSGVRWLVHGDVQRFDNMTKAADLFNSIVNAPCPRIAVENPIMHGYARARASGAWLTADTQYVQPWMFGDPAFKATGLTLVGLPRLVEDPAVSLRNARPERGTQEHKDWSFIHRMPPGPNRARERSRTFPGIAEAFAKNWG